MIIINEVSAAIRDNTRHAGLRRRKRGYGRAGTIAVVLLAVALVVFGCGAMPR